MDGGGGLWVKGLSSDGRASRTDMDRDRCSHHHLWVAAACVVVTSVAATAWHLRNGFPGPGTVDLHDQAQLARNLAEGRGLRTSVLRPADALSAKRLGPVPDVYQPPLVPVLLACVFALSQPDDRAVGVTLTVVHVALSLAVFVVGVRLLGLATGAVAAVLWAAGWSSLTLDFADAKSSLVAALLLAIGAYLAVSNGSGDPSSGGGGCPRRPLPWFRIGVLAGLAFLTEYSAALVGIALAAWCGVTEGARRWRRIGALCAGLACCVVPWGLRNARVAGNPLHTMAKLHVLADMSYFPGSSVFRREDARGLSAVGFLVQHPRSLLRKGARSWQRLAEGGVPGMSWPLAGLFLAGLLTGFREARADALGGWTVALAGCGMVAVALTGSPLALLPAMMPLVALLGSHYLVEVIQERVGEDPLVIGGKGRLIAMSPQVVRGGALAAVVLASLFPTWSRAVGRDQRPGWPPQADMAALGSHLTGRDSVVISDVPWLVAWRTGRTSLWLPGVVQADRQAASVPQEVAALYLSPQVLRYGPGEQVEPWQRMFLGRSRPDGFDVPIRLPEGGRLFLREGDKVTR
jgi:hypothetical protein